MGQFFFGLIFCWTVFCLEQISFGSSFHWDNFLLGQVSIFWVQQSQGQFSLDQTLLGTNCFGIIFFGLIFCWTVLCWVSFPLGQISIGTIFSWVKFPFFGFKCPWVNLPWTKFHLGLIVFGAIFLGQISEILTSLGSIYLGPKCYWVEFPWCNVVWVNLPWAKRLGPNALDPLTVHQKNQKKHKDRDFLLISHFRSLYLKA